MSDAKPSDERVEFQCSNGHKMSAGPKLFGMKRECPKCKVEVAIPFPTPKSDDDVDMDEIMDVLMGGDAPDLPREEKTSFFQPKTQKKDSRQRRCEHCKKLNPVNYRFCGHCKEQLILLRTY